MEISRMSLQSIRSNFVAIISSNFLFYFCIGSNRGRSCASILSPYKWVWWCPSWMGNIMAVNCNNDWLRWISTAIYRFKSNCNRVCGNATYWTLSLEFTLVWWFVCSYYCRCQCSLGWHCCRLVIILLHCIQFPCWTYFYCNNRWVLFFLPFPLFSFIYPFTVKTWVFNRANSRCKHCNDDVISGLFAQFFWQRLSLPTDRTTFLLYAVTGMVFAIGAIVQVYFSTWCSFENANAEHGCPLPDFFNHNVIMHFIQVSFFHIFQNYPLSLK